MKQAIIVRTDLKMDRGKIASQCSHASVSALMGSTKTKSDKWLKQGMKKVVLKVKNEKDLINVYKKAKKEKIVCALITDAGLTQVSPGTLTALGIGPDVDEKIDKVTGKLKLL